MANRPSQKWDGGKLVERAKDARGATEENEAAPVTGRPNDTPVRDPEPAPLGGNTTFAERAKVRGVGGKQVNSDAVEDKSIGAAERKSDKGRR